jgi:hypothetical protein
VNLSNWAVFHWAALFCVRPFFVTIARHLQDEEIRLSLGRSGPCQPTTVTSHLRGLRWPTGLGRFTVFDVLLQNWMLVALAIILVSIVVSWWLLR